MPCKASTSAWPHLLFKERVDAPRRGLVVDRAVPEPPRATVTEAEDRAGAVDQHCVPVPTSHVSDAQRALMRAEGPQWQRRHPCVVSRRSVLLQQPLPLRRHPCRRPPDVHLARGAVIVAVVVVVAGGGRPGELQRLLRVDAVVKGIGRGPEQRAGLPPIIVRRARCEVRDVPSATGPPQQGERVSVARSLRANKTTASWSE